MKQGTPEGGLALICATLSRKMWHIVLKIWFGLAIAMGIKNGKAEKSLNFRLRNFIKVVKNAH